MFRGKSAGFGDATSQSKENRRQTTLKSAFTPREDGHSRNERTTRAILPSQTNAAGVSLQGRTLRYGAPGKATAITHSAAPGPANADLLFRPADLLQGSQIPGQPLLFLLQIVLV